MASDGLYTLGDYFTLQRGITYHSSLLDDPGPVLLGLATIERNGGFRADSLRTYGGESPEKLLVQPGELYLSLKDVTQSADLLGAVARLPADHPPGRLTQDTVKLQPKHQNVPLDYLYWVLRTPQYRSYCRAHATGTTNLGLARDDFLAYPVPPLTTTRQRLVDVLDGLEAKIELNRRMSQTLESMARALFKSWFVDLDDTSLLVDGASADSEMGLTRAGWEMRPLSDLFDLERGLSYNGAGLSQGGTPMITLGCFGPRGEFLESGMKGYRGEYRSRHTLRTGDLTIANTDITQRREVLGSPVLVPTLSGADTCLFTHHVFAARFHAGKGDLWREFAYCALLQEGFREKARGFATGTTVLSLPADAVLRHEVLMPPEPVVQAFNRQVVPFRQHRWQLAAESRVLSSVRRALLPLLIGGIGAGGGEGGGAL